MNLGDIFGCWDNRRWWVTCGVDRQRCFFLVAEWGLWRLSCRAWKRWDLYWICGCRVTFRWDFTGQVQHPKHHCSWYILGFVLAAFEAGFQTWSLEWTEVHSERMCIDVWAKRNKTDRIRSDSDLDIERQTPWLVRKHEKTKDKRTRTVTKGIPGVSHSLAILRSNLATQEVSDARRAPFFPEVLLKGFGAVGYSSMATACPHSLESFVGALKSTASLLCRCKFFVRHWPWLWVPMSRMTGAFPCHVLQCDAWCLVALQG